MYTAGEILEKEYQALPLSKPYSHLLGRFSHSGSILMSGFPGGGKSTLALQLLDDIKQHGNVLYVPAEEGADSFTTQEKIKRLRISKDIMLAEWEGFELLKDTIRDHNIISVCLDSITYIDRNLREFEQFREWAKDRDISLIVVAHSTKNGTYKGTSDLEHMVDTSIWIEGAIARTKKNRFGPCPKEIEISMDRENPKPHTRSKEEFETARAAWSDVADKTGLEPKDVRSDHNDNEWRFIEKKAKKRDNPITFIENSEGQINFGDISAKIAKKIKRQPGKIRLTQNGLDHAQKHKTQINDLGYQSVIAFIEHISQEFEKIFEDKGALFLVVKNRPSKLMIIRLEQFEEGEFYVIKTAFPVRTDFFKNKKPLWERAQSSHRNNATPGAFSGHNGLDKDTNILISRQNMQLGNDCVVNADVKINENKNGVEVRFTNTPPKEILDILNKSGFLFWTPENESPFWSAKKTPEAIQAIKKITDTFPNGKKKDDVEKKSDKSPDKNKDFNFIVGNNTTIDFKADGSKSVQGEYLIIEANDLVPSHNKDCSVNSDHEITGAQPRDRTAKELCNQSKVIADNLNPTSITTGNLAFNGAPVTWKLGQVIQGNGRSIALKIAYDEVEKSAKKYRKFLIKNANDFGFEQEAIEDFEEPVLVRMVDTSQNEALKLGNIVDTSQAKLNRLDEAKAFVRNLSTQKKQIIGRLINDSSGETIGQIIDDIGLKVIDQLKELDPTGLINNDGLTADGKAFLKQLFVALVFDTETENAVKFFNKLKHTQKAGIERSFGHIIPLVNADADIAPDLQKAVEITAQIQQNDSIDTIEDFMQQGDAFTGLNQDRFNTVQTDMARALLKATTQKEIRSMFRSYEIKINGREDLIDPIESVSPQDAKKEIFSDGVRVNPESLALVFLGFCEQIHIDQGHEIKYMEGKYPMFTNNQGNELLIIPRERVQETRGKVDDMDAIAMFEEWSHYPASMKDFEIDMPEVESQHIGHANLILYASDKVMKNGDKKGKIHYYRHEFDKRKRPARLIDDVIIIEDISITGRGIMN